MTQETETKENSDDLWEEKGKKNTKSTYNKSLPESLYPKN